MAITTRTQGQRNWLHPPSYGWTFPSTGVVFPNGRTVTGFKSVWCVLNSQLLCLQNLSIAAGCNCPVRLQHTDVNPLTWRDGDCSPWAKSECDAVVTRAEHFREARRICSPLGTHPRVQQYWQPLPLHPGKVGGSTAVETCCMSESGSGEDNSICLAFWRLLLLLAVCSATWGSSFPCPHLAHAEGNYPSHWQLFSLWFCSQEQSTC